MYDLPAKINHIISVTKQEKIFYIGHSQGVTSFYVMASERTEYNDKIRAMISLAPPVFASDLPNPIIQFYANLARHFYVSTFSSRLLINKNRADFTDVFFF